MRTKIMILLAVTGASLAASAAAQQLNAIVPKAYATGGNRQSQVPFAMQPLRWQQVYFGKELGQDIKSPVRFKGLRYRSATTGSSGAQFECDIRLSHLNTYSNTSFDANLPNPVAVLGRRQITMPTSTALAWDVVLPFDKDFTWDGKSDVVVDLRIWSNSRNSQQFLYFFDQVIDLSVGIETLYAINPTASTATFRGAGNGLVTRFDYEEGVVLNYGAGCQGDGNVVPKIGSNGIPIVGNVNLQLTLAKARPQAPVLLLWGGSNTQWGAFKLPLDLAPIGIPGCSLLAEPLFVFTGTTAGGAPGTGQASLPFGIPPAGIFKGIVLYAQFAVVDPTFPIRVHPLTFSDALHLIIG